MNLELLTELCRTPGAPGREDAIRAVARRELEPLVDEAWVDPMGSLVARRAGDGPRLMLCAHMDEIAFMVRHVEDSGYIRILPLGGFDAKTLTAQRVIVHGREDLLGVMGSKAIHLMSAEERKRTVKLEDFYVDVGLPGDRVKELVRPGDVVTREREITRMGDLVTGKSLDNRAGLYVMIEAMRALGDTACEVFAVAAVQEEVGLRGARVAAARIRPEVALAIDITLANDGPDTKPHERVSDVGGGAAIKVYDTSAIVPRAIVEHLVRVAEERDIPHQLEVMPGGGTDTRELQLSGDGAPAGCVSIPTRYVHQSVETCHPDDLDACVALVAAFCETAETLVPPRVTPEALMAAAEAAFRGAADPARAAAMSAYMRGRFPFLGIPRPERARLERPLLAGLRMAEDDLARAADACWALPEREFQYLGCVLLERHAAGLSPGFIGVVERCITTRAWWDTVDHLASRVVGPMVRAHPELADVMDDWAGRQDIWLARTAIIHQLGAGGATDADRLFGYCALRAGDTDFFIRKGIGWALRQHARTDPDAVRAFVAAHRDVLSPLSVREATKHL